jgi:hypothetical protein
MQGAFTVNCILIHNYLNAFFEYYFILIKMESKAILARVIYYWKQITQNK